MATRKLIFGGQVLFTLLFSAIAQESPTPSPSPAREGPPSATPDQSASPSPTISPARKVRLSFVPPPMEGTISLGIFDETGKLVRVLHREAKIADFTVGADSLDTAWDGKNDAGEDLPPGRFRARGYAVGDLKIEEIGRHEGPVFIDPPDFVPISLIKNPLLGETRSVVNITAGSDRQSAYLMTSDGLPLRTIAPTEDITGYAALTKKNEKYLTFWIRQGNTTQEFQITGAENMMVFDCGFFELK